MLRAEHDSAKQAESRRQDLAELDDMRARAAASRGEVESLRARLGQVEEVLAASKAAGPSADAGRLAELEARLRDSEERERRVAELEALARDSEERERRVAELEALVRDSENRERRVAELEALVRENENRERRLAELRAEAPDPEEVYQRLFDLETQYQAATMAAARVPALEAKVAELEARVAQLPTP
jgi:DNA repair exonuclease SbcCD ATPase subunit